MDTIEQTVKIERSDRYGITGTVTADSCEWQFEFDAEEGTTDIWRYNSGAYEDVEDALGAAEVTDLYEAVFEGAAIPVVLPVGAS